jgi:hypothetical protein
MQIIALFHYLWFVIYKRLLSNMHNDLKGRRGENFVLGARRLNQKVRTIKVNVMLQQHTLQLRYLWGRTPIPIECGGWLDPRAGLNMFGGEKISHWD